MLPDKLSVYAAVNNGTKNVVIINSDYENDITCSIDIGNGDIEEYTFTSMSITVLSIENGIVTQQKVEF